MGASYSCSAERSSDADWFPLRGDFWGVDFVEEGCSFGRSVEVEGLTVCELGGVEEETTGEGFFSTSEGEELDARGAAQPNTSNRPLSCVGKRVPIGIVTSSAREVSLE